MAIRGQYHTQSQNISIDLSAHLFADDEPVLFHELTHYYLTNYTNEGAVFSILSENCLPPKKLVVKKDLVEKAISLLHGDMYEAQEGFAHLMQAMQIFDKQGGMSAVKDWEDTLPIKPKRAFNFIRYALNLPLEIRENFIGKLSDISLNTNIYLEVINDSNFIVSDKLEEYLKEENNSSKKRFEKVSREVERNNGLLNSSSEDICNKIGITYYPIISNKDKAELINVITALTDSPASASESDIRSLDFTKIIVPGIESTIIVDANIANNALVITKEDEILNELKYSRTVFAYNCSEARKIPGYFGFYSFSKKRYIINGYLEAKKGLEEIIKNYCVTKVIDTASFDFNKNKVKSESNFLNPDIIWHKNYNDLLPFIEMAERLNLTVESNIVAFTDEHPYRFYLLRVSGENLFHIIVGYPFIGTKLLEAKFSQVTVDLFAMITGKENHLNNFFHDILGIPFLLNFTEMVKDADAHLKIAEEVKNKGMGRNDACVCGSAKKWKYCHGWIN